MKFFSLVPLFFIMVSCTGNSTNSLSSNDSSVVQFYVPGSIIVDRTINTVDNMAIQKVEGFIADAQSEEHKCNNEGKLLFFKNEKLEKEVQFAYSWPLCHRFTWITGAITKDAKMSNEAADFLKRLAEAKNWY